MKIIEARTTGGPLHGQESNIKIDHEVNYGLNLCDLEAKSVTKIIESWLTQK